MTKEPFDPNKINIRVKKQAPKEFAVKPKEATKPERMIPALGAISDVYKKTQRGQRKAREQETAKKVYESEAEITESKIQARKLNAENELEQAKRARVTERMRTELMQEDMAEEVDHLRQLRDAERDNEIDAIKLGGEKERYNFESTKRPKPKRILSAEEEARIEIRRGKSVPFPEYGENTIALNEEIMRDMRIGQLSDYDGFSDDEKETYERLFQVALHKDQGHGA